MSYAEVFRDVAAAAAALPTPQDPRDAAALARAGKEAARRARLFESIAERTVFLNNVPFKATEQELIGALQGCGKVSHVRLSKDKATSKVLGYAHVRFETPEAARAAEASYSRFELHDRVVHLASAQPGQRTEFKLPQDIQDDITNLLREAYEGHNLSTIRDAWQKRHPGQKLDVQKWGFKNFSTALKTIASICLERHLEKSLTILAFLTGSERHKAFVSKRQCKEAAAALAVLPVRRRLRGKQSPPAPWRHARAGSGP